VTVTTGSLQQGKTGILGNCVFATFSKNIKQLTYAGFRMNRKYCYQSATKFSKVYLTRVLRSILQEWACGVVSDCEELVGVTHRRWWGWFYKNWGLIHFFHKFPLWSS